MRMDSSSCADSSSLRTTLSPYSEVSDSLSVFRLSVSTKISSSPSSGTWLAIRISWSIRLTLNLFPACKKGTLKLEESVDTTECFYTSILLVIKDVSSDWAIVGNISMGVGKDSDGSPDLKLLQSSPFTK